MEAQQQRQRQDRAQSVSARALEPAALVSFEVPQRPLEEAVDAAVGRGGEEDKALEEEGHSLSFG